MPDPSRRREDARRRILAAALELLAESGYQRLTIEGIAARAGVGKQTIYRWWSSKGAVVLDAFLDHPAATHTSESPAADFPSTGDFAADLRQLVRATVAEFSDPAFEAPYRALTVAIQDDPQLAAQVTERLVRTSLDTTRDWFVEASRGTAYTSGPDPDFLLELIFGPIMHRWLLRTRPLTQDFADALTDAVLRLMGDPAPPPR